MFKNAGRKIMTLANVLFCLGCIATLIATIVIGLLNLYSIFYGDRYSDYYLYLEILFFVLKMLPILVGGILLSWLINLFLYAFGRLVDSWESAADYGERIHDKLERLEQEQQANAYYKKDAPQPSVDEPVNEPVGEPFAQ